MFKHNRPWLAVLLVAVALLCACAPAAQTSPSPAPATDATESPADSPADSPAESPEQSPAAQEESFAVLTDVLGREVVLAERPATIVSLTPTNTEIVCALGLSDLLVGVDAYSNYPASVEGLEKVGDYSGPNAESIVALAPDLVLAGDKLQQESIDQLSQLGLTVLATEVGTYDAVADSIRLVAQATGTQDQAETLIADMEARTQAVLEKASGLAEEDKPSVYWAVSFGEYGDYTVGPGSFPDEIIRMAGGVNVSGESEFAWPMYSPEQIVADDPDLIIIPGDEAMKESFLATESYQSLTAVKEGKVYCVDGDIVSRPGPRLVDALEAVYAILHPEG